MKEFIEPCYVCGGTVIPVWFTEEERDRNNVLTGRVRRAVSHLECSHCWKKFTVDDSFDGPYIRR